MPRKEFLDEERSQKDRICKKHPYEFIKMMFNHRSLGLPRSVKTCSGSRVDDQWVKPTKSATFVEIHVEEDGMYENKTKRVKLCCTIDVLTKDCGLGIQVCDWWTHERRNLVAFDM